MKLTGFSPDSHPKRGTKLRFFALITLCWLSVGLLPAQAVTSAPGSGWLDHPAAAPLDTIPDEDCSGFQRPLAEKPAARSASRASNGHLCHVVHVRIDLRRGTLWIVAFAVYTDPRYDAYGVVLSEEIYNTGAGALTDTQITSGLKYKGQTFDAETGQVYLRNRYYEPETGQFTQVDPARAGDNWYAYTDGDPVNRIDPNGLNWVWNGSDWDPDFVFDPNVPRPLKNFTPP